MSDLRDIQFPMFNYCISKLLPLALCPVPQAHNKVAPALAVEGLEAVELSLLYLPGLHAP